MVTPNSVGDSEVVGEMLDDIEDVGQLSGDGAYDRGYIYDYVDEREVVTSLSHTRKDAKIWFHGNRKGPKQ